MPLICPAWASATKTERDRGGRISEGSGANSRRALSAIARRSSSRRDVPAPLPTHPSSSRRRRARRRSRRPCRSSRGCPTPARAPLSREGGGTTPEHEGGAARRSDGDGSAALTGDLPVRLKHGEGRQPAGRASLPRGVRRVGARVREGQVAPHPATGATAKSYAAVPGVPWPARTPPRVPSCLASRPWNRPGRTWKPLRTASRHAAGARAALSRSDPAPAASSRSRSKVQPSAGASFQAQNLVSSASLCTR